jgi:putative transposase
MCWLEIPHCHRHVHLDAFVVMPDHIHGILRFVDNLVAPDRPRRFGDAVPGSLSTILGAYKAEVTKRINAQRHTSGQRVWQRNYYEHVVRNQTDIQRIRWYIITNPIRWDRRHRSDARG